MTAITRQLAGSGPFQLERAAPSAALAGLVDYYWCRSWDMQGGLPQLHETLPHPSVHMVVEAQHDGVHGARTARHTRLREGRGYAFGVKFRPGAFQPLLGGPVAVLTDRHIPLATVFGEAGRAYAEAVRACAGLAGMAGVAEAFLSERVPRPDANGVLAGELVGKVAADPAITSVEALVAASGVNLRTLQRLFQRYVGVPPGWVIKRYRMHEAVARIQSGAPIALSQLAAELGYRDQRDFSREFSSLVGKPPGEYARA